MWRAVRGDKTAAPATRRDARRWRCLWRCNLRWMRAPTAIQIRKAPHARSTDTASFQCCAACAIVSEAELRAADSASALLAATYNTHAAAMPNPTNRIQSAIRLTNQPAVTVADTVAACPSVCAEFSDEDNSNDCIGPSGGAHLILADAPIAAISLAAARARDGGDLNFESDVASAQRSAVPKRAAGRKSAGRMS